MPFFYVGSIKPTALEVSSKVGSLKRWPGYLVLLLVLAFGVLFAIQNTTAVPLDLLLVQLHEQSVALWVLLAFAIGGIAGLLVSSVALVRLKSRMVLLQRRLEKQGRELDQLRTADLRGAPSVLKKAPSGLKKTTSSLKSNGALKKG